MVISCVIVLALLSFVTATPHEYGAKTGAIAKAEANAAAGTFGVIPLHIPSGSGFSGSFSKSSSSSFASSSSSASSSSYSFSGHNGIPGVGCLSGTCKSGQTIPSSLNGSPNTQIMHHSSEASAVAAAKASAESSTYFNSGSNAPCQQGNCKGLSGSTKCETGLCDRSTEIADKPVNGIHTIDSKNQQECLSGNCLLTSKQQTDNISNADDVEVNFDRNSKTNNPSYSGSFPQLKNAIPSSTSSSKCNSPSCDTFLPLSPSDNAQPFNPQKPATHLVTPNLRPLCTTHNCKTDSPILNDNNGKPSSYNVPILGTNPSFQHNIPYNPSMGSSTNIPSQANCGSNGCLSSSAQANPGVIGLKTPKYSHLNYPLSPPNNVNFGVPHSTTIKLPLSCNTPNCGNFPVPNPSVNPGWSNTIKPNFVSTPVNHNVSPYNNMFVGAVGSTTIYPGLLNMAQPNNYANQNVPSYSHGLQPGHPGLAGTMKPNLATISDNQNVHMYTNGFGGPPGPVNAAVYPGSLISIKPNSNKESTESNLPLYTGGFGGPSGSVTAAVPASMFTTVTPNLNIQPHGPTYNSGSSGPSGALGDSTKIQHNKPGYTPINTNAAATLPIISPSNFVQNNAINPTGHDNTDMLQKPVNQKEKLPPYTGGFGGPSGILKPNEFNMPSKLTSPIPAMPCATFDCSKQPISNENYSKAEASATALANAETVSYAGGFGAPPGLLQPEKSQTGNTNSDSKSDDKNNKVNNAKIPGDYVAGNQENSGVKKPAINDNASLNDYIEQANIADTHPSSQSQNNVVGNSPAVNNKEKEFNDYIKQANIAGAFASAGAQTNVGGTSPAVNNNKHDNSDKNQMLNDYFTQANIADAFTGAGAQTNLADQDNFVALTGSNSSQNSGCNSNCRPNSNGGAVAGASASATGISNAGSWATGQSFASGAASAHASSGASFKGSYGRR